MNYVISIINPDALGALTEICEKLSLPLTVTLHGRGTAMQGMHIRWNVCAVRFAGKSGS